MVKRNQEPDPTTSGGGTAMLRQLRQGGRGDGHFESPLAMGFGDRTSNGMTVGWKGHYHQPETQSKPQNGKDLTPGMRSGLIARARRLPQTAG